MKKNCQQLLFFVSLCLFAFTAKAQNSNIDEKKLIECVEGFYSELQKAVRSSASVSDFEEGLKKSLHYYIGEKNDLDIVDMPSDIIIITGKKYTKPPLKSYISVLNEMRESSDFDLAFDVLGTKLGTSNRLSVLVSKVIVYKGRRFDYIDWVLVKHIDGDIGDNNYTIEKIIGTSTVRILGNGGVPITSATVSSKTSVDLLFKLPNNSGETVVGMENTTRTLTITDPNYSDTVVIAIKRYETRVVQLNEKAIFRLFVPFAFPLGKLGKGSENWTGGGNAWENNPFDLTYFFDDNKTLSKAARSIGFAIGAKAIIPLKRSTMAIMTKAEYLLMLSNNGKMVLQQDFPAEILYYQYVPSSGVNIMKIMEINMNVVYPRLNTVDVMIGINKKFRNVIGSSNLELEGAVGAAWHWASDFSGKSIRTDEFNFDAKYGIFTKIPSLAFETGVYLTLGNHLTLGLNYAYLGGFDVKGHASWSSTIIPPNDANINNVDFNFGHVNVHYLGLVVSYSL